MGRSYSCPLYSLCEGSCASVLGLTLLLLVLHLFYGKLARMFPGKSPRVVATKIALDQTLWAPFSISSFFWVTGALEGRSFNDIKQSYQQVLPSI